MTASISMISRITITLAVPAAISISALLLLDASDPSLLDASDPSLLVPSDPSLLVPSFSPVVHSPSIDESMTTGQVLSRLNNCKSIGMDTVPDTHSLINCNSSGTEA